MGFLKGFGAFVLGLLLFISLSTFGLAYMLGTTVLSPGFVKKQVDRIDISGVARDLADEQIQDYLPPELYFLKDAVYNAIDDQAPWIKDQANRAIDSGYAFFLGKTDTLAINIPLTAFKANLKDSLWKEMNKQLASWLRGNITTLLEPYIFQNLQQYRSLLPGDLAGMTDAQLRTYLDAFLKTVQAQIIATGVAPALSGLLEILVRPYFDDYYNEYAAQIPDSLTADKSNIPAATMDDLRLARKYIGEFRGTYYWLIVIMVGCAVGTFLIYRNVQDPSRALGIDLFIFGALDLAGVLALRSFSPVSSLLDLLPQKMPSLEPWLEAVFRDVTGKMMVFSIAVLVVGAALIAVSFIFREKEAEA